MNRNQLDKLINNGKLTKFYAGEYYGDNDSEFNDLLEELEISDDNEHEINALLEDLEELEIPEDTDPEMIEELVKEAEKKNTVQKFIDTLKAMQKLGIDITKITQNDTIQSLAQKSGIRLTKEEYEELKKVSGGVDKIGIRYTNIAQAYRNKGDFKKPTNGQMEELRNLEISLEEINAVQKLIDTLNAMQKLGIDVSKIARTYDETIETLAKKSGIELTEEEYKELKKIAGGTDKIGSRYSDIAQAYRGNGSMKKPTQEQINALSDMGISLERKQKLNNKEAEQQALLAKRDSAVQLLAGTKKALAGQAKEEQIQ